MVFDCPLTSSGIMLSPSSKVTPSFPSDVLECILDSVTLADTSPAIHACALLCLLNKACQLYCLRDRECWTFTAMVTGTWKGDSASTVTYDICYSTWYHSNDITHFVIGTSASSIYNPLSTPDKAVNGFICKWDCFHSNEQNGMSWWRADLGAPRSVSTIQVQTRRDGYWRSNFHHVIITLGNSSDYVNPVFDTYPYKATSGELLTFTPSTPIIGRYLQFDTNDNVHLSFSEIKIIS
ncbi:hypothetical protein Pcinc_019556 [Petrolisthes cinctipes]|uniref:F5/8 type C domain-containing protein n=1 Tax=Petrolisthes cinctipes TaxID=88211 RepID=A0AAE1FK00_PETCI|nr:hypothetical protein Pcinc_019556 [Petrolisthes cinctipes]